VSEARNYWKSAFWIACVLWLGTVSLHLYSTVDQGVSLTYLREGYADCEAHRDFLSEQAKGHLTRSQVEAGSREPGVEVQYADDDTYRASSYGASMTPDFRPDL